MKQLRNILTGVLLACGLSLPAVSVQADSIPVAQNGLVAELDSMAQRDDVTCRARGEYGDVKEIVFGHMAIQIRMAHHRFRRNEGYHSVARHCI